MKHLSVFFLFFQTTTSWIQRYDRQPLWYKIRAIFTKNEFLTKKIKEKNAYLDCRIKPDYLSSFFFLSNFLQQRFWLLRPGKIMKHLLQINFQFFLTKSSAVKPGVESSNIFCFYAQNFSIINFWRYDGPLYLTEERFQKKSKKCEDWAL